MGLNVNLCAMFGLPKKCECPSCKKQVATNFSDFDIEAYEPHNGVLEAPAYCDKCEHEWNITVTFNPKVT